MARAYDSCASKSHCSDASIELAHDSLFKEAFIHAQVAQIRWNGDLVHQLHISQAGGVALNTSRQVWLLKQRFLNQHPGA